MFDLRTIFTRKAQPAVPQLKRAAHMSKAEFLSVLGSDALAAFRSADMTTYNMLLDEIDVIDRMSSAEYAFYCYQRATNASYSFSPDAPLQLALF